MRTSSRYQLVLLAVLAAFAPASTAQWCTTRTAFGECIESYADPVQACAARWKLSPSQGVVDPT